MKEAHLYVVIVLSSVLREVSIFPFVGSHHSSIFTMSTRRRRYQSLGLLKRSHNRQGGGPFEGVEKFVTESQVNDMVLYTRVTRARPGIRQLQFANDDVDWHLEYFCDRLGRWMRRILGWLLGILQSFMQFLGFKRKERDADGDDKGDENRECGGKCNKKIFNPDHWDGNGKLSLANERIAIKYPEVIWRFENCIPFLNRRPLKRKWLLDPRTRGWAEERIEFFQKHVNRGFRTLCSVVGKDTRIHVVCSSSEARAISATDKTSLAASSPQTFVFRADSKVLRSYSEQFALWFAISGNDKRIFTSYVTPQEMQALLVYMYTLTWPKDVMTQNGEGMKTSLDPKFLEVLRIHGISLKLEKEIPPPELRRTSSRSNVLESSVKEEPPGKDKNLNDMPSQQVDGNILLNPVTVSSHFVTNANSIDGQGDCSPCFQDAEVFEYVNEKDSTTTKADLPSSLPPPSTQSSSSVIEQSTNSQTQDSSLRSLNTSKLAKAKDSSNISFFSRRNRVHPEAFLTSNRRSRLKIVNELVAPSVNFSTDKDSGG